MLIIRLPEKIQKRLEKLALRTGRTINFHIREAILKHLDALEDLYLAEKVLKRVESGEERTILLKEVMKRYRPAR